MARQPNIHQMTIGEFETKFPDDESCKKYGSSWKRVGKFTLLVSVRC